MLTITRPTPLVLGVPIVQLSDSDLALAELALSRALARAERARARLARSESDDPEAEEERRWLYDWSTLSVDQHRVALAALRAAIISPPPPDGICTVASHRHCDEEQGEL